MADIDIKIDDTEVKDLLDKLAKRSSDMTPAMKTIGEIIRTSVVTNFEVGGRYSEPGSWRGGSNRWQPLSAATLLAGFRKRKHLTKTRALKSGAVKGGGYRKSFVNLLAGGNRKVLIKEGNLMDSIKPKPSKTGVEVGTNKKYAAIHQFGGPAGRKTKRVKIPARPFLVIQDEDMAEIKRVLEGHLTEGL